MVELMAKAPPALAARDKENLDPNVDEVLVDNPQGKDWTQEGQDKAVKKLRETIGNNRCATFPWQPQNPERWKWDERSLAEMCGGLTATGKVSLKQDVEWQCKEHILRDIDISKCRLLAAKARNSRKGKNGGHMVVGSMEDFKAKVDDGTDRVNLLDLRWSRAEIPLLIQ